jgi:uncharacterized membrane protein
MLGSGVNLCNWTDTTMKPWWLVPAALVLLGLVPAVAGGVRLAELATVAEITPQNARFVTAPLPVVLHILTVTIYAFLGAFQFSGEIRRRYIRWHRAAGRFLVPVGLFAALSGLWMTQSYVPPPLDEGTLLYLVRWAVGICMTAFLILGFVAIRRRQISNHQAWMMRAYGLGMGAGTQVLTHLPWVLAIGMPATVETRTFLMTAGWVINILVVEGILARKARKQRPEGRMPPASLPS